jgi:hypothetical protein
MITIGARQHFSGNARRSKSDLVSLNAEVFLASATVEIVLSFKKSSLPGSPRPDQLPEPL